MAIVKPVSKMQKEDILRICSQEDRDLQTRVKEMSFQDYERLTYLIMCFGNQRYL